MEYVSLCSYTVMQKNYVFIAAIFSELHAPWQPVMQGYVVGLTTRNGPWTPMGVQELIL